MRLNLLQIAQSLARRTNLPLPGAVMGVNQAEVRQIVALIEEVGSELVSRFNWQQLKEKSSWAAAATSAQGNLYILAGTSLERILPGTFWDETQREPFVGPIPYDEWQGYSAGLTPSPQNIFTIYQDIIYLWPVPNVGNTLSFFWQSANWIQGSDGTRKASFTSDEDTPLFDGSLIQLGLRAKWKMEKGLPYAEDMRAFELMAKDKSSRGMLQPTVSMSGEPGSPRPAILVPLNSTIPNA